MLILFLIDTSASMNQKTCLGTTYLDIAKGAVESFIKVRAPFLLLAWLTTIYRFQVCNLHKAAATWRRKPR